MPESDEIKAGDSGGKELIRKNPATVVRQIGVRNNKCETNLRLVKHKEKDFEQEP